MLMEGLSAPSKRRFQDEHGGYLDVCDLAFIDCDADQNVFSVLLPYNWRIEGSIDLAFLPPSVVKLIATSTQGLEGTVNTSILPQDLSRIALGHSFSGPFNMATLPKDLCSIDIFNNQFCGSLALGHLPEFMEHINAHGNRFTGSIHLESLPSSLNFLWINHNQLSGNLDLRSLPTALESLNLCNNAFSGSVNLVNLPVNLTLINLGTNKLSGTVVLQEKVNGRKFRLLIGQNAISNVVNEKGKEHGFAKRLLQTQRKA